VKKNHIIRTVQIVTSAALIEVQMKEPATDLYKIILLNPLDG